MEQVATLNDGKNNFSPSTTSDAVEVKVPAILFDLIPKYLENRRNEVKNLDEALKNTDFATIRSIGHKLKGNAGSYGFTYLTELGAQLEAAAIGEDFNVCTEVVSTYQAYLARIKPVPDSQ